MTAYKKVERYLCKNKYLSTEDEKNTTNSQPSLWNLYLNSRKIVHIDILRLFLTWEWTNSSTEALLSRDKALAPKRFEQAVHLDNFQVLLGDRE